MPVRMTDAEIAEIGKTIAIACSGRLFSESQHVEEHHIACVIAPRLIADLEAARAERQDRAKDALHCESALAIAVEDRDAARAQAFADCAEEMQRHSIECNDLDCWTAMREWLDRRARPADAPDCSRTVTSGGESMKPDMSKQWFDKANIPSPLASSEASKERDAPSVSPEPLYYIQTLGYVGNCLLWWRPNGNGYTCDLNKAWKVTKLHADDLCSVRRGEDIAWPVSLIDEKAARHLDSETWTAHLRDAKA